MKRAGLDSVGPKPASGRPEQQAAAPLQTEMLLLAIRADVWPGIGTGGWPHICVGSGPAFGMGIWAVLCAGIPTVWGCVSGNADLDSSMFCTEVSRRLVVLYLEEDTATLLVGHQGHPRNTLCDLYIAELPCSWAGRYGPRHDRAVAST